MVLNSYVFDAGLISNYRRVRLRNVKYFTLLVLANFTQIMKIGRIEIGSIFIPYGTPQHMWLIKTVKQGLSQPVHSPQLMRLRNSLF